MSESISGFCRYGGVEVKLTDEQLREAVDAGGVIINFGYRWSQCQDRDVEMVGGDIKVTGDTRYGIAAHKGDEDTHIMFASQDDFNKFWLLLGGTL